jgi:hypothetical protein
VKKRLKNRSACNKILMILVSLVLTSLAAFAAGEGEAVISKDGRTIRAMNAVPTVTRAPSPSDTGLVTIFDNIGRAYPDGTYWCCEASSITGPNATGGFLPELWLAVAFTPEANHLITKVEVAVSLLLGSDELDLSVNNDADGLPGTTIISGHMTQLPVFGSCCTVEAKEDTDGIPVTAGTQYWIVVKPHGNNSDTFAGWNVEDTDQVDLYSAPIAFYCSDNKGGRCQNNNSWTLASGGGTQGPAFAVLGR